MTVKYGVISQNYGRALTKEGLCERVLALERLGFDYAFVGDHIAQTPDVSTHVPGAFYDCFTTLGFLAAITERITIGAGVVVLPLRHPAAVARAIATATADQLSGGRLVFGIGAGWAAQEFEALGLDPGVRGKVTDEHLEAIRAIWRGGPVGHHGEFVRFNQVAVEPRPIHQAGPALWIGGGSTAALRRAVRFDAVAYPGGALSWADYDRLVSQLRSLAEEAGKPVPDVALHVELDIAAKRKPRGGPERPIGQGSWEQLREDVGFLEARGCAALVFDPAPAYRGHRPDEATPDRRARERGEIQQLAAALPGLRQQ